ncbi:MAG: cohesin domain-containing protein, partial [Thermoanaerobaculia bacterium]
IPIIGRLFGKTSSNIKRSDVMLTLTPHIIRTPEITEGDLMPIWVGTESNISFRGGTPRVESEAEGPFDDGQSSADAEEKIREQVQRLPRGLRSEGVTGAGPAAAEPLGGVNLAPGGAPSNPFATPEKKPEPVDDERPDNGSARLGSPAESGTPLDLIATSAAGSTGFASARLRLLPKSVEIAPGGSFEMEVEIATTAAVAHVPMTLTWDPALLALDRVVAGDFLGTTKNAGFTSDASTPGTLVLQADRVTGASGVAGNGALAHVSFRALGSGIATVTVASSHVADAELYELAAVVAAPSEVVIRTPDDSGLTVLETVETVDPVAPFAEPDGGS